jgi:hypothetical protein
MRKYLLLVALLVLPTLSEAQVVPEGNRLTSKNTVTITWPELAVSPDGLDKPDGVRVKANPVAGSSVAPRSWDLGPTVRSLVLTPQMIPTGGAFTLTVHPFNVEGEAVASSALGPFGRIRTPASVAGVSGGVQ